jgi:hypothetical protein
MYSGTFPYGQYIGPGNTRNEILLLVYAENSGDYEDESCTGIFLRHFYLSIGEVGWNVLRLTSGQQANYSPSH